MLANATHAGAAETANGISVAIAPMCGSPGKQSDLRLITRRHERSRAGRGRMREGSFRYATAAAYDRAGDDRCIVNSTGCEWSMTHS